MRRPLAILVLFLTLQLTGAKSRLVPVADGYSATSVNTAVFRANSIVSDGDWQYVSFYDPDGYMVLGKRRHESTDWDLHRTQYKGNVADAHNVISIAVDGEGYLHVTFDHHGHPLKYCRSIAPGALELGELEPMVGRDEDNLTYPEFYRLPNGDLIFAYRDGASGRGNLVLNRYLTDRRQWKRVQDILVDGEGQRNAYWQICMGPSGTLHLSWVWRETWLVETNHDLCYARSSDGGLTWQRSDGTDYQLPITAATAEYAWRIPQNSELINQTSMATDEDGHPFIATYWRDEDRDVPQYRLVWHDGQQWQHIQVGNRFKPFSLSGGGTKMIPIARPRIAIGGETIYYIMRDEERGGKPSIAVNHHLGKGAWEITDISDIYANAWEPTYDMQRWQDDRSLNIFFQAARQGDGENQVSGEIEKVYVIEIEGYN